MLTNQFYYSIYKPYFLGILEGVGRNNQEYLKRLEMEYENSFYITLNVSDKAEVIEHAKNVSMSVNELRYSLKIILRNIDAREFDDIAEQLNKFAKAYNKAIQFLLNQPHCRTLKVFARRIKSYIRKNRKFLIYLKLRLRKGRIRFMPKSFSKLSQEELQKGITANKPLLSSLYNGMGKVLSYPLAVHMRFSDTRLYNNYEIGFTEKNGQILVESGMLVDKTF